MSTARPARPWLSVSFGMVSLALISLAAGLVSGCEKKRSEAEPVPAVASATPGSPQRVEVTADGFQPSRVNLGATRRIVFRRTTDGTCATAVVFPDLKIEKDLPLNQDVVIDLPASAKGELGFQCGMGMYQSKVVVQ